MAASEAFDVFHSMHPVREERGRRVQSAVNSEVTMLLSIIDVLACVEILWPMAQRPAKAAKHSAFQPPR